LVLALVVAFRRVVVVFIFATGGSSPDAAPSTFFFRPPPRFFTGSSSEPSAMLDFALACNLSGLFFGQKMEALFIHDDGKINPRA